MRYLLLIYDNEQVGNSRTEDERQNVYREYRQLIDKLEAEGKYITGNQLQPTNTANTVKVRNGKPLIMDGPFAETREQLGGFFLIDVSGLDEAREIAARIPSARTGSIEVRPLVPRAEPATA